MTEQIWCRKCKIEGCEHVALYYSDYCAIHKKELKDKLNNEKEGGGE